jgi:hypothetical protein
MPFVHTPPLNWHCPLQQGSRLPPHGWQVVSTAEQTVFAAVHLSP